MKTSNVAIRKVNLKIAKNVLLPDTKIQSIGTSGNDRGAADQQRRLGATHCVANHLGTACCADFLMILLSEILNKNIIIYVLDVALSTGGLGFG